MIEIGDFLAATGPQKRQRSSKRMRDVGIHLMNSGAQGRGGGSTMEMLGNLAQVYAGNRLQNQAERQDRDRMTALAEALQGGADPTQALLGSGEQEFMRMGIAKMLQSPSERKTEKDANGRLRFVDNGEYVFDDIGLPGPDFDTDQKFRKEFASLPETKSFSEISRQYNNLKSSAELGTGAGDIGVVFSFMKMLDPQSVVTEGEQATAQNAGGVGARWRNLYNQMLTGASLDQSVRQQILQASHSMYGNAYDAVQGRHNAYDAMAPQYGIDMANVYTMPERAEAPVLQGSLPPGVTEEDINHTMQLHNLSREEVLRRLGDQ